jgi:hypothetical protein
MHGTKRAIRVRLPGLVADDAEQRKDHPVRRYRQFLEHNQTSVIRRCSCCADHALGRRRGMDSIAEQHLSAEGLSASAGFSGGTK